MAAPEREIREFAAAFNAQELDRLVALLDPDVVIHARRGPVGGRDAVREWARMSEDGSLVQRIEVDDVEVNGEHALARMRKQWTWRDTADGGVADESRYSAVVSFRDGRIASWRPFDEHEDAVRELDRLGGSQGVEDAGVPAPASDAR